MENLNLSNFKADFIEMIVSKVTERANENLKENNNKINDLQAKKAFKDQLIDYISDNLNKINSLDDYIDTRIDNIDPNNYVIKKIDDYLANKINDLEIKINNTDGIDNYFDNKVNTLELENKSMIYKLILMINQNPLNIKG